MVRKKDGPSNQTFEIMDAKSGFVHLRESPEGTDDKVAVEEFLKDYEMLQKQIAAPHPGWPIDYMCTKQYMKHVAQIRIMSALHAAAASASDALDNIVVMEKPKRSVVARHALALSTLMLVPNALRVATEEIGGSKPVGRPADDSAEKVFVDIPDSWKMECLRDERFSLVPFFSKEVPCPAWAVRTTDKQDLANMEWRFMVVSEVAVAEAPKHFIKPKVGGPKVKVSTKSSPEEVNQQHAPGMEHELRVPVMINAKAIKADDELFVYRAPKRQGERKVESVKVAKLMKASTK